MFFFLIWNSSPVLEYWPEMWTLGTGYSYFTLKHKHQTQVSAGARLEAAAGMRCSVKLCLQQAMQEQITDAKFHDSILRRFRGIAEKTRVGEGLKRPLSGRMFCIFRLGYLCVIRKAAAGGI